MLKSRINDFKIKSFENFFLHNADELSKKEFLRAIKIMKILKKEKLIKKIGISIYNENSVRKLTQLDVIDIVQIPLNLCDRRFIRKKNMNFLKRKILEFKQDQSFSRDCYYKILTKLKVNLI